MKCLSTVAVIATAWGSRFGGINNFSTDLCRSLVRVVTDYRVLCICLTATEADRKEAKAAGLEILSLGLPSAIAAKPELAKQVLDLLAKSSINDVKWWIGHDAITGQLALACAKQSPNSRCAVLMHMSYEDYAYMKHAPNEAGAVADLAEVQRSVLRSAHVGLAVGPLLYKRLVELRKDGSPSVMLVPGLTDQAAQFPTMDRLHAITFGRFELAELLTKQVPLVVAAFGRAIRIGFESRNSVLENAHLRVIGVPPDVTSALRTLGEKEAGRVVNLKALDFIEDKSRLRNLLHDCNTCLMLSWHEGFGLSAWEAIGSGIPVIISRNSGVFRLLDSVGGSAVGCVFDIDVRGRGDGHPNEDDIEATKRAILSIASDIPKALANAKSLRHLLRFKCNFTWDCTAENLARALDLPIAKTMLDSISTVDLRILTEPSDVVEGMEIAAAQRIIRLAETYYLSGQYTEALDALETLKGDARLHRASSIAMDATIIEAEVCLRLNQYQRGRALVSKVAREAIERSDWPRYVRARSVENVMLRDQSKYEEATALATELLRVAEQHCSDNVERVCRLLARSLALNCRSDEAVRYATKALESAQGRRDGDAQAKATFALGEAYRHGLNQPMAIKWYTESRDMSGRAGDVDCFLWSVLGLADSLFLTGEYKSSADMVQRLKNYIDRPSHVHPLESLHIRLSLLSVACHEGYDIADDTTDLLDTYKGLGVIWPNEYVAALNAGDFTQPKRF